MIFHQIIIEKGKTLSIDSISRYLNCSKCNSKIELDAKLFVDCPYYKVKQKVKACKLNMMVRVESRIKMISKHTLQPCLNSRS